MLNCEQFREVIIRPVLNHLQLYTPVAEELLIATVAHESKGGTYLKQINGPALGIYQMEPKTHDDLWNSFFPNHSDLSYRLMTVCKMSTKPTSDMMIFNLFYATAVARCLYARCAQALPMHGDLGELWLYYKKWWNTKKGDAQQDEFVQDYLTFTKGGVFYEKEAPQGKGKREAQRKAG